ncbi:MAG: AAA family ATPase [Butyricicoccus sp.]|nr:ParA family protein [Butyricicoccus pullicaecorum]MCI6720608.1 AAA family ATPase [Clostridiales bacterium]MDY5972900.1 AAA family ATPase [Butyricicoccus sp.]
MAKIVALINQKGGVGKTTTAVNLACALTEKGKKVLLCDFDPQGNATSGVGIDPRTLDPSIYELIIDDDPDVRAAVIHTEWVDVLGANVDLAGAEVDLISLPRREYRLKDVLDKIRTDYDYIIIDCPPSLGILTLDCLCAADSFLVPLQTEYYALEGLSQLMATVRSVQRSLNRHIRIEGILLTMYDGRTNLAVQVVEEVKKHFGDRVYASVVPRNIRLSEAPSHGKPIMAYDRSCRGAAAYLAVADEFLEKNA